MREQHGRYQGPLNRQPHRPRRWRRYQSTISGSFQVVEIIETFVSYMESLDRCVW